MWLVEPICRSATSALGRPTHTSVSSLWESDQASWWWVDLWRRRVPAPCALPPRCPLSPRHLELTRASHLVGRSHNGRSPMEGLANAAAAKQPNGGPCECGRGRTPAAVVQTRDLERLLPRDQGGAKDEILAQEKMNRQGWDLGTGGRDLGCEAEAVTEAPATSSSLPSSFPAPAKATVKRGLHLLNLGSQTGERRRVWWVVGPIYADVALWHVDPTSHSRRNYYKNHSRRKSERLASSRSQNTRCCNSRRKSEHWQ